MKSTNNERYYKKKIRKNNKQQIKTTERTAIKLCDIPGLLFGQIIKKVKSLFNFEYRIAAISPTLVSKF